MVLRRFASGDRRRQNSDHEPSTPSIGYEYNHRNQEASTVLHSPQLEQGPLTLLSSKYTGPPTQAFCNQFTHLAIGNNSKKSNNDNSNSNQACNICVKNGCNWCPTTNNRSQPLCFFNDLNGLNCIGGVFNNQTTCEAFNLAQALFNSLLLIILVTLCCCSIFGAVAFCCKLLRQCKCSICMFHCTCVDTSPHHHHRARPHVVYISHDNHDHTAMSSYPMAQADQPIMAQARALHPLNDPDGQMVHTIDSSQVIPITEATPKNQNSNASSNVPLAQPISVPMPIAMSAARAGAYQPIPIVSAASGLPSNYSGNIAASSRIASLPESSTSNHWNY